MLAYKRLVAEIDLDAADFNIKSILKRIDGRADVIGTIKADAYGHGALEIAKVLMENGVSMFSVAMLDEAVNLRKNGIDKPVLILGVTPPDYAEEAVKYGLIQTVPDYATAESISKAAVRLGKKAAVHIKIDTGMGRIGFKPDTEAVDEIERISKLDGIDIEGIFTHFCTSDEKDKSFTVLQRERFVKTVAALEERGIHIPLKHTAASAGIMDFDDLFFNAVRPGIILYGCYPSAEVMKDRLPLKPVMSLKTYAMFIKEIEEGDTVGYGRTYKAEEKRKIATIPAGYADGYNRLLSNRGRVLINGRSAPIRGRICMDQCMADITGIEAAQWDEVVLLGRQGNEEITADEIAEKIGTISYEVLCMVAKRVPRVYVKNGRAIKEVNFLV
ncbi:alanine racemase [Lachnospiraceae bacterium NSJ-143]|nr:alanine racemase [Lachnospiraceae bacterium NSJ-143]